MKKVMYNIGICYDGKNICSYFENIISSYMQRGKKRFYIETWNTGEDLQQYLEEGNQLDILFLDIELFELSGIDVGNYIRNKLENRNMQIIYISGKTSYAQRLFKTQPMDFLVKPISKKQIEEALNLAIKILSKNMNNFEFQIGREYYHIPFNKIVYFSSTGRIVKIVSSEQITDMVGDMERNTVKEIEFYGKLKNIAKSLPVNFLVIHQSYIVNTDYVMRYTYEEVELMDGTILSISKSHKKIVRQFLLQGEQ